MKYKIEWELLFEKREQKSADIMLHQRLMRMKVPGGWVLSSITVVMNSSEFYPVETMTFVPDSNYTWELEVDT